jgi:hypothetical protein
MEQKFKASVALRVREFEKSDYQRRHVHPSVCLTVRMEKFGSLWKNFYEM